MNTLTVELGERSYPIHIGSDLITDTELFRQHIAGTSVLIVSDENVAPLYLKPLLDTLASYDCQHLSLPAGEKHKNLTTVSSIYDALIQHRFDRNCCIVALGGGVVGDITGFAAASYQRGVSFLQVPTTLLSQVDSSVGGKTGVNHPMGKNMIGAFHQPDCVIADMNTLDTLPARELRAGLAEIIKYGLINDRDFYLWLDQHIDDLIRLDKKTLAQAVERSCANKARIVAADELESGQRALLNLGHTFGHAIETAMGYGNWLHGEAIAAGMCLAARFSADLDMLQEDEVSAVEKIFKKSGLPISPPTEMTAEGCLELMSLDKKVRDKKLTLVLLRSIGEAYLSDNFDQQQLQKTLKTAFS